MTKPFPTTIAVLLLACALLSSACQTAGRSCLNIEASPSLNLYQGQPHATAIYLYPLISALEFEQTPVPDLLSNAAPRGTQGPPLKLTLLPGEERWVDERFNPSTRQVGMVANFYRGPDAREGIRKAILPTSCGLFGLGAPAVFLGRSDLVYRR